MPLGCPNSNEPSPNKNGCDESDYVHDERQEAGKERSRGDEGEKETKHWGKGLDTEKAVSEVTGAIKKRSSHSR